MMYGGKSRFRTPGVEAVRGNMLMVVDDDIAAAAIEED